MFHDHRSSNAATREEQTLHLQADADTEPGTSSGNAGFAQNSSSVNNSFRQHSWLKRQRGSGIEYLMQQLQLGADDETSAGEVSSPLSPHRHDHFRQHLSSSAKTLLRNLLMDHGVLISAPSESWLSHQVPRKKRKPLETSMSDERVMQLAQEGELSFLASLLKVMEEEGGGSVTTKFLIKACCLSVEPARVPSVCDAKEMVMAALYFLSQSFAPESDGSNFLPMPLIRCVHATPDLEKRSYEQHGDWTTRDPSFLDRVLQLEQVFYNSIDYKYLAREHMCPNLPSGGRDLLLLKGSPPAYCMGKSRKAPAPRRKKGGDDPGNGGPAAGPTEDGAD
jgi:hypothetical protein